MLYLVGGVSRSGKTRIARKILADRQVPYLSLDWLMMGFNDGIPEYGIHHLLWPDEIARKMSPFLQGMIDCMLADVTDYVIEGEAMLPEFVADLMAKNPEKVRAAFLGYTAIDPEEKISLVKRYSAGDSDWLTGQSDEYIRDHVGNMIAYSKMSKEECERHGVPYFDTSGDFQEATEAATRFLVGNDG